MENIKARAEDLTESVTDYIHTYYKLSVLNATDKATTVASSALTGLAVLFLGMFVLLFSSIALAIWLGSLLENQALGYLIVAGIYLLKVLALVLLRKRIIFPLFRNLIIGKLYEEDDQNI
ncbi:MAG: phage holin family protein [Flavitalea sp.]